MRRTKTICTIGPSSESPRILEKLVVLGMDIARINFSHATFDQFHHSKGLIKKFNTMHHKHVKILMDLQGPRFRVGMLPDKGIKLVDGQTVLFSTNPGNKKAIYINDPYLHKDVKPKQPMYLSNGDIELKVTTIDSADIHALVIRGGILYSRKGINFPDTNLTTSSLTEKDYLDIEFGIHNNVDYIALSFVKDTQDIIALRKYTKGHPIKIISKIERKLAMTHLDEIIRASDAVMVARGDLGIELPLEELPMIQKDIIEKANKLKKPSIVATQMLMSMVNHYRPTRAEVSDVANAVLDGADALMLSDETAFGKYPLEALTYLIKTIQNVEEYQHQRI